MKESIKKAKEKMAEALNNEVKNKKAAEAKKIADKAAAIAKAKALAT